MDRQNARFLTLLAACAAALSLGASCSSGGGVKNCVSNADCASGQVCNQGLCYITKPSSGSASASAGNTGATAGNGSTGGHSAGQSSGGNGSGSGSTTAAAGSAGSTGSGPGSGGGTGGPTGSSSNGTSGGGCSCSTSCCSQAGTAGITCPDGKQCYGTVPDAGSQLFYCNDQTGKCDPFDPCNGASGVWTCGESPDGGTSSSASGGTTGSAPTIDPTGMSFVATGDTRPNSDGSGYPQSTVNAIYTDFGSLSPKPMAVIATGDFQEQGDSNPTSEIDDYETAIKLFSPTTTYPSMGNHECVSTSITTYCEVSGSNSSNNTPAFSAFLQMLVDLGINPNTSSPPYYYKTLTAPNGDTAKFVILAAQAWDSAQVTWLTNTLAIPSTFTFVARHEPDDAVGCTDSTSGDNTTNNCPFIAQVQEAINADPGSVTMLVEGHTHELRLSVDSDEIVSGAGGVAIETGCTASDDLYCNFGYVYCQERTDKSMICNMYDYQSGMITGMACPGCTGSYATYSAVSATAAGVMSYAN